MSSHSEVSYYQEGDITITSARAMLGSKTYAMANITSVSMGTIPPDRALGVLVVLVGLLISVCSGMAVLENNNAGGIFLGLIVVGVGVVIAASKKTKYVVKIGSASGESNALVATDEEYIQKIVDAVNEAIIMRG